MSKSNKVPSFGVYNPTNKYALVVDGFFGFFSEKEALMETWNKANQQFEYHHGSMEILEPNQKASPSRAGMVNIAEHQPIDIAGYVAKKGTRKKHKVKTKSCLPIRFIEFKNQRSPDLNWDDLDLRTTEELWKTVVHGVDWDSYSYE